MKRSNASIGAPVKHRTPLALFRKASGLTYQAIAANTGESEAMLHKVSGKFGPMPMRMADALSTTYGLSREWLLGEIKSRKPLHIRHRRTTEEGGGFEDVVWTPECVPSHPVYSPSDKVDAYLKALDAVTGAIGYRLSPPKSATDKRKWQWRIAAAFDWYTFTGIGESQTDQSAKITNRGTRTAAPHMVEALRHIVEIEKRWNASQVKFTDSEQRRVDIFFKDEVDKAIAKPRLQLDVSVLELEMKHLLADIATHPRGPLARVAAMSALQQIRMRFEIERQAGAESR